MERNEPKVECVGFGMSQKWNEQEMELECFRMSQNGMRRIWNDLV